MHKHFRFIDLAPEIPLVFEPNAIELYADAVGTLEVLGHNFRTTFVAYRMQGEQIVRVPVAQIVRPIGSSMTGRNGLLRILGLTDATEH